MSTMWERTRRVTRKKTPVLDGIPIFPIAGAAPVEAPSYHLSSGGMPVTIGDYLTVRTTSLSAARRTEVAYRILTPEGDIQYSEYLFTPTASLADDQFEIPLQDGILLAVTATVEDSALSGDLNYGTIALKRGTSDTERFNAILVQGYYRRKQGLFWPGGRSQRMEEAFGKWRNQTVADPSPGASYSFNTNTALKTRLVALSFRLVTGATVGDRRCYIQLSESGVTYLKTGAGVNQAASLTVDYSCYPGAMSDLVFGTLANISFPPDLWIEPGTSFSISATGLTATDQFSNLNIRWEDRLDEDAY